MDEIERPMEQAEGTAEGTVEPVEAVSAALAQEELERTGVDDGAADVADKGAETTNDGVSETADAKAEAINLEAQWERRVEAYAARAVFSEARAAAAALGVPEGRLDYAARLADTSGIDPEDEGAREKIARAVRAVLKDLPELRGGAGTGQTISARRPRRDAFEKGFLGE